MILEVGDDKHPTQALQLGFELALKERDAVLREKAKALEERDSAIRHLQQFKSERDNALASLENLTGKPAKLSNAYVSISKTERLSIICSYFGVVSRPHSPKLW